MHSNKVFFSSLIVFMVYAMLFSCKKNGGSPRIIDQPPVTTLAPPLPPSGKLYVGAFCNQLQDTTDPRNPTGMAVSVLAMERELGHPLAIITHYYNTTTSLNDTVLASDAKNGRIPIITLTSGGDANTTLAGKRDSIFIARAKDFKNFGKPIFIRYFTAMNRPGVGDRHNKDLGYDLGKSPPEDSLRAAKYVELWRYVYNIFKAQGATNVAWVWSVGDEKEEWTDDYAEAYYPGNEYVDWIGLNGYNQHDNPKAGPFTVRFAPFFNFWWNKTAKPEMMTESGSPTNTQSQVNWLTEAHANIQAKIPGLKAFNYFNSIGSSGHNFFLSGDGLAAYVKMANDPNFSFRP